MLFLLHKQNIVVSLLMIQQLLLHLLLCKKKKKLLARHQFTSEHFFQTPNYHNYRYLPPTRATNYYPNIATALQNPIPNAPLSQISNSQAAALRQLTQLLTTAIDNAATRDIDDTTPAQPNAPRLRVEPPKAPDTITYHEATKPKSRRNKQKQKPSDNTSVPQQRTEATTDATAAPTLDPSTPTPEEPSQSPTKRYSRRLRQQQIQQNQPAALNATTDATPAPATPTPMDPRTNDSDMLWDDNDLHWALHGTAINPDTGTVAEYDELSKCSDGEHWINSNAEEFARLAQGLGPGSNMPEGTNTLFFIHPSKIPSGRSATYLRIVCADRPEKAQPRRVRHTLGGDRIDYPGNTSTKTADLTTAKVLINSTISTKGGRFMTADIKDFYLGTPLERYEYVRIALKQIPQIIIDYYKLEEIAVNGYVYAECRRGMYGLPQAGILANKQLQKKLEPHGYRPVPFTPGLWTHDTRNIFFALVVDDFGVKHIEDTDDAKHLITALTTEGYSVSVDWDGKRYCGLTIDWDYTARTATLSMPGYVERALQRFQHPVPSKPEHAPHDWKPPQYGAKIQYAESPDETPYLDVADKKRVQEVLGTLLYYARAIDITMLKAIGTIATQQANPTEATMKALVKLLNYAATHPDAELRYVASDMCLWNDSDASYLSEAKARSTCAGYHFLSDQPKDPDKPPDPNDPEPMHNAPVHVTCNIMREVVSSASEAELGGLFYTAKDAVPIRTCLEELGHPQPPTPLKTDNTTASGIVNDTVKQKKSKALDMRFYWIRDRVEQGQFHVYWRKAGVNKADYFTKHHPAQHHQDMRGIYLHQANHATNHNYYEILDPEVSNELDPDHESTVQFDPMVEILTYDPNRSCEGVLIPGNPESIHDPSKTRTLPVGIASNGILAHAQRHHRSNSRKPRARLILM
jgi:hypothetical protein